MGLGCSGKILPPSSPSSSPTRGWGGGGGARIRLFPKSSHKNAPGANFCPGKAKVSAPQPRVGDDGGGDDGDDGRIFPEHPSPILHAPRDNISCKGKSLASIYKFCLSDDPVKKIECHCRSEGFALTGYDIPGCVEDGTWMLWENSSIAVVVVAVVVVAVVIVAIAPAARRLRRRRRGLHTARLGGPPPPPLHAVHRT